MKNILKILAIILVLASSVKAQTLSPLVTEGSHKSSGSFNITNNTLQSLSVVLEPQSISLVKMGDGWAQKFRPLDSTVQLQLSETSARLGPKETHEFTFRLRCDAGPCNVAIMNGMIVGHTQASKDAPAVAVRIILMHVIYGGCEKAQGCRKQQLDAAPREDTAPVVPTPQVSQNQ